MLITDKHELEKYSDKYRIWQGIPGIERTSKGRLFATFYSGGVTEALGNYVVLIKSDDDGETWGDPIAVAYKSQFYRCFDPCLWIDPLGRLWFLWSVMPDNAVYASICDDPDADDMKWHEEIFVGRDVMVNKPVVLSSGEWMFPVAVWDKNVFVVPDSKNKNEESGSFVYRTSDNGKSFVKLGSPIINARSFDEHMVIELTNNILMMLVRTKLGISKSYSYDSGITWTHEEIFNQKGPDSRFHIRRLKSGRIILINHYNFKGRNNLTAMLSDDEGKTWKWQILLDERDNVSYPDMKEGNDGYLYIIYDHERGAYKKSYAAAEAEAREILLAKITEDDIINGSLINKGSRLKMVVSKLGEYCGDAEKLYSGNSGYSTEELKLRLAELSDTDEILKFLFNLFAINCQNMHYLDIKKLDLLIEKFICEIEEQNTVLEEIIGVLKKADSVNCVNREEPIVQYAVNYIIDHYNSEIKVQDIAEQLKISIFYLCHVFRQKVGLNILKYRDAYRFGVAKKALIETNDSVTKIASECGYDDFNYFIKKFKRNEGITPQNYRKLHQIKCDTQ